MELTIDGSMCGSLISIFIIGMGMAALLGFSPFGMFLDVLI